ncbi:peptidoglycan DD-metalloendopeptidase family protein [Fulvivirga sedimenti]|uniref:Peptidoglycan DD-metalloendopeptidase family protein n=1 Tax=Fulvivirga sedimenti TaxID=2879465 RepID=A0A9X1KXM0_9BACT|nr:peptidoglycan DD-metalloendopeptidase family protein [Fulvivirga sedimenti]MCA6075169.1 peptidoglycan DD-metalloendopeptidase family protein [Fulvivirga sedimenti]MCA6076346.1 peptidoglycan DD-metalloendopeptidase family protein [Fulvivirga sedimenti]MCA6077474.1 peptidoglycan DD-metalloendopeptidase family protein [Fulvivirga sedimenti]
MARIKYYYDTETCKYERIKVRTQDVIWNVLGLASLILVSSVGIVFLFFSYFESPKEVRLTNEVEEMQHYYENLDKEVTQLHEVLAALERRDDNLYRVVLGSEPIDPSVRNAGIGGTDRYTELRNKDLDNKDIIVELKEDVDKLRRKMYIQSKSYDEIADLAESKEKLFAAIPAIQPVSNEELIRLASGFGYRTHPIYKVRKMHPGIDFSAPPGTPIYATADGTVVKAQVRFSGYGKLIEIDHGFGYKTRYAHMQEFEVKSGQTVKRGQVIGYVGSTGLSTAPHLHYEVLKNDKQINPVHYFFNDLNPDEYEKIIELASIENQSLGM